MTHKLLRLNTLGESLDLAHAMLYVGAERRKTEEFKQLWLSN